MNKLWHKKHYQGLQVLQGGQTKAMRNDENTWHSFLSYCGYVNSSGHPTNKTTEFYTRNKTKRIRIVGFYHFILKLLTFTDRLYFKTK